MNTWSCAIKMVSVVCLLGLLPGHIAGAEDSQSGQSLQRSAVQMLLSADADTQNRGRALILQDRAQLIKELQTLILDEENFVQRTRSVEAAIALLGEIRAVEAIELLVTVIDYPLSPHPTAKTPNQMLRSLPSRGPTSMGNLLKPKSERCPAVRALINIGEPCLNQVIERVASSHGDVVTSAEAAVLRGLQERAPVRERLKRAIAHARPPERDRLKRALEALDIDPVKYRQERLRRYAQEIWEKSQKQKQKR